MRKKKIGEPLDEQTLIPRERRMCMFDRERQCTSTCAGYGDFEYEDVVECIRTGRKIKITTEGD